MVISLREPSDEQVLSLLEIQRAQEFTYPEPGVTRALMMADSGMAEAEVPAGYRIVRQAVRIGEGAAPFGKAQAALKSWGMARLPWLRLVAPGPAEPEAVVAVVIRAAGLWTVHCNRVVYVLDEPGPPRRFGVAYGTLPAHAERGEELFLVEEDPDDGAVWYGIMSVSRPAGLLTRLGSPLARSLQRRFVQGSLGAVARAAGE